MKKWMVVAGMMMVRFTVSSQCVYETMNFEDSTTCYLLSFESDSDTTNIWQIATPNKQVFSTAVSSPNVLITDSINSYPINDTSSVIIKHLAWGGLVENGTTTITGWYWVNSDTLTDYGQIEFSPDNGSTWIDLLNDTYYQSYIYWYFPPPIFSGNSDGWQNFSVYFTLLGSLFGIQLLDTILYRISFISDSIQTYKDGLMFDDLFLEDFWWGIEEIQSNHLLHLSPNPASDLLHISFDQPVTNGTVCIISCEGKMMSCKEVNTHSAAFDVSSLPAGMYYVQFRNENMVAVRKVVVGH